MCRSPPLGILARNAARASALAFSDFATSKARTARCSTGVAPCASSTAGISARVESSNSDASVNARLRRRCETWSMRGMEARLSLQRGCRHPAYRGYRHPDARLVWRRQPGLLYFSWMLEPAGVDRADL